MNDLEKIVYLIEYRESIVRSSKKKGTKVRHSLYFQKEDEYVALFPKGKTPPSVTKIISTGKRISGFLNIEYKKEKLERGKEFFIDAV